MKRFLLLGLVAVASVSGLSAQSDVVIFHDSPTEMTYDPSWSFYTEPSELIIMAGKFEVTTAIKKDGANGLRLEWRSEESGDWGACVARDAWATYDLNNFKEIRFWVYSEQAIAANLLPELSFEANGGKKTGRLKLGAYLTSGLTATTWAEVVVPIADVKAATTDASYPWEVVKTFFFLQDATDAAVHAMYIDEIVLKVDEGYQAPTSLDLFTDSSDDGYYDPSWVNVTAPSSVVQPDGKDKLPVVASPVKAGTNAIKLAWTSVEGGDWMTLLAAKNWAGKDLTNMTDLSIWVNSPVALAKNLLPKLDLEGVTGGRSGKVELKNYVASDLAADTWTEIIVPIADIKASNPAATTAWINVKGLFFSQGEADGAAHTLYIDEVKYRNSNTSGLIENIVPTVRVAYSDGAILINNYEGAVTVFNGLGQLIKSTVTTDGSVPVNLKKGVYIVKTQTGSAKILVF